MSYGTIGMKFLFRTGNSVGTAAGKVGNPGSADFGHQCFYYIHTFLWVGCSWCGLVVLGVGWFYLVCRTSNSAVCHSRDLFKMLPPTSQCSDTPCSDVLSQKYWCVLNNFTRCYISS